MGERLERLQETGTTGVFGRVGDPGALVPAERDPVTGKPLDPRRARRNKRQQQSNRPSVPRSKALVAAAIGAVVLVGAGIAVAASGSSGGKHTTAPGASGPGAGGSGPTGVSGSPLPGQGAVFTSADYRGITIIKSHVLDSGGGYTDDGLRTLDLNLECNKAGCALNLGPFSSQRGPNNGLLMTARSPANGWSFRSAVHNANGLFYQCIPSVPGDWTLDLRGVGITHLQGFDVPARIRGTIARKSPQTSNCPGIDGEYAVDAPASSPFGSPVAVGVG